MSGTTALPYPRDEPETVVRAALRCDRLASWVDRLGGDLAHDGARLQGSWQGPAAAACRDELGAVTLLVRSTAAPLHAVGRLLRAYALEVTDTRRHVDRLRAEYDELVESHRREMAAVLARPGLTGPQRQLWAQECRSAQTAALARVLARHRAALVDLSARAARTSQRVVAVTRDVLPPRPLGGRPVTDLEADIVRVLPLLAERRRLAGVSSGLLAGGAPPSRLRAWWSLLTPDEQDRLVRTWPAQVGAMDGVPAAARSRANHIRLRRETAALRGLGVRTADQQRRLDNCLVVRDRLAFLRSRRDPRTNQPSVVQLLVFEPSAFGGQGRVAIAVGDLDTADHVAVLVPGMGSDVRSHLGDLTGDALRVRVRAQHVAGGTQTAAVAWMGYDTPDLVGAGGDGAAERGADLLAADLLGWQVARETLPHLTVVGHSYGSTTAGTSMRDHATGTDDLVLLGSPGANVETASQLRVPSGHVYVGGSSRDPVSYLDRFGADPTHRDFGAVRFQAEDVTRNASMLDGRDHSKYLDPSTESLHNVVRVVVGDYSAVRPAEYRGEAWFRPDGINDDPEADREPTGRR